jgi:hypothetical protein
VFLKQFEHAIEIGIAGAKTPRQPVPTALCNPLAVRNNRELAGLAGRNDSVNIQALLDEGHETRDLGFVVLSRRTVNDFDLQFTLSSASRGTVGSIGSSSYGNCRLRRRFRIRNSRIAVVLLP